MDNDFSTDISDVKGWRRGIKIVAYVVYFAGALFATITFSQHVSDHFPTDHILRLMASAGAWANLFSLALMPIAKEYWVSGGAMTIAAWLFWIVEFAMVILNTLAAYGSAWALWWTDLSPASPVIVIGIWGVLWYLNPEAKAHQRKVQFYVKAQEDFQDKLTIAMKSQRVQDIMRDGAAQAAQQYAERTLGVAVDPTHKSKSRPSQLSDNSILSSLINAEAERLNGSRGGAQVYNSEIEDVTRKNGRRG